MTVSASIRKRAIKGGVVYALSLKAPDPSTGEVREQERGRYRTRREANAAKARLLSEAEAGLLVEKSPRTLSELLEFWLENEVVPNRRGTTIDRYRSLVRVHLAPGLGYIKVQELAPHHVLQFYSQKKATGTGGGTLVLCHVVLGLALRMAHRDLGWVGRNIMESVKRPCHETRTKDVWNPDQLSRFLAASEDGGYGPLWLLAALTGMRRGELLGLRWKDVDLGQGTISIVQTKVARDHGMETSGPKSAKGRRVMHLRPVLVESLRGHRVRQNEYRLKAGTVWRDHDLVFCTEVGTPIHARSLWNRYRALTKKAGVPPIGLHGLRHTVATVAIASGEDVRTVSDLLGHSRTSITTDTYAHVLPHRKRELARNIERLLLGASEDDVTA